MRVWVLLAVLCLSGCGSLITMAELEQQALLTGDWSEVERHQRIIARRNARHGLVCPAGLIAFCPNGNKERCSCIKKDAYNAFANRNRVYD